MKIKKYLWGIIFGIILTSYTAYILLDTFVVERIYTTEPVKNSQFEALNDTINLDKGEIKTSDYSYKDENISINLTEHRQNDTTIYVADVILSDASLLKTAFAKDSFGKNVTEKTSKMAANSKAILAINGDYYGTQEKGYVLRNGALYRDTVNKNKEDLVIYPDGSFEIILEKEISAETLVQNNASQVLSFGPSLLINGKIAIDEDEEVGISMASNPRTAIGIIDNLHYVFIVSDGRTKASTGLSLYELAEFMQNLDVKIAYNLDGGGSSTMYFNGEIINNPTTNGKKISERSVSDIVYIGY